MKDTIIKGNGKSRNIKAPADMPETFEEWRTQLLAGSATLDIGLNAAGCDVVGTAMSKANLLSDTTKNALELTGSDPTVNDAIYTLSKSITPAEVHVLADVGTVVTMTRGAKTLTASVAADGYAVLYARELGDWTIVYTLDGVQKIKIYTLDTIGIHYVYPFEVGVTLDETSWENIALVSKYGKAQDYWKIGDIKRIQYSNTDYNVRIIGFDHDPLSVADGNRTMAGITFEFVNLLRQEKMNSTATNSGGWANSDMRNSTLSSELEMLPADLQSVLKVVSKTTNNETTTDKLFLLSVTEINGSNPYVSLGDGTQYEYYTAGNSKIKTYKSGGLDSYWTRSPYTGDTKSFIYINLRGETSYQYANVNTYISYAFCV